MKSEVFSKFKIPVIDYKIEAGADQFDTPWLVFTAPNEPIRRFYLQTAEQMRQEMERTGERENAAELARLIGKAKK